jgi:hypothetical protein
MSIVYAARLNVKPCPSTLSETFAILLRLKEFGVVNTFYQIQRARKRPTDNQDLHQDGENNYSVTYTSLSSFETKELLREELEFGVAANFDHPDPRDLDPYNIRGLLERKPQPKLQIFKCKLIPGQEQDDTKIRDKCEEPNPYQGRFLVDRHSIFDEILAKSNTPPALIDGLLPIVEGKLKRNPRSNSGLDNSAKDSNTYDTPIKPASVHLADFSLSRMYKKATENS